jgi:hypothetical protein
VLVKARSTPVDSALLTVNADPRRRGDGLEA